MKKYIKNLLMCLMAAFVVTLIPMASSADEDVLAVAKAAEPELTVSSKAIWVGGAGYTFKVQNIEKKDYTIYYTVKDKDMATVNYKTGYVKGISTGDTAKTTFYAVLIHNKTGEVTVLDATLYVKEKASKVEIVNKEEAEIALYPGDKIDFDSLMYNKAGQATDTRCKYVTDYAIWSVDDKSVATIDRETGILTAKAEGTVTVTVGTYVYDDGSGRCNAFDTVEVYVVASEDEPVATPTPTVKPTAKPTTKPSATPTTKPSVTPTIKPSVSPTIKPSATPTPSVTVAPDQLIVDIKQTSMNTVVVTFAQDMSKLVTKNNIYLRNENRVVQLLKSVILSEDGYTAEVHTWNSLDKGKSYTLTYGNSQKGFMSSEGKITVIDVKSKSVVNLVETPVEIKLYDANGVDLTTTEALSQLSYNCENAFFNSMTRTITPFILGSEAKLTVTYTSNEYDVTTGTYRTYTGTGRFLSVEAEPVYIESIKVGIGKSVDYTKPTQSIAFGDMGYYIYAQAESSDGTIKKTEFGEGNLTFKSTDSSKLLVTEKTGYLVPISEGTVQLLVYDGEIIIADYELQILPARKPVRLVLSKSAIKVTKGLLEDSSVIEVTAFDQYGDEIDVSNNMSVAQAASTSSTSVDINPYINGNKITINGALFTAPGIYRYTVSYMNATQSFAVTVSTAGKATSHEIDVSAAVVDAACKSADDIGKNVTIRMFSYDNAGNRVEIIDNNSIFAEMKYGYTITKSGANEATFATPFPVDGIITVPIISTDGTSIVKADAGTYIIKIYLSADGTGKSTTIGYKYFEVVDTQVAPTIDIESLSLSVADINDNNAIMNCFSVNKEAFTSINNLRRYVLTSIDKQFVDPILWVKSITLLEYFTLDGQDYYIEHTTKVDAMITTY